MMAEPGRSHGVWGTGERRRAKARGRSRLAQIVETLEGRTMLSAASIDVHQVLWNGELIDAVRDEYVLRMPQLNASRATSVADFASRTPRAPNGWQIDPLGMGFYKLTAPGASEQIVTAWAQRQLVRYIEPNAVRHAAATPNDPLYGAPQNWGFQQIGAEEAWDTGTGSESTVVAVLDTGVDYNHPDLRDNMWQDPATGAYGFNAVANNANPMDDNGHGTFAAGLIGAVGNNADGMAGVNWTVQLMAVKVLNAAGVGTSAQVIRGVNYVTSQKIAGQSISTVHCGFARSDFSQGEFEALQVLGATGVVIVSAAGNEASDNDANPRYPANYSVPTLISVAASAEDDALAGFSNFGRQTVHLAAPGVNVLSTRAGGAGDARFPAYEGDDDYTVADAVSVSGTSFASAFVAGAAALLKAVKPTASASQIRSAILEGVDRVPDLSALVATGGRLNLANSVDLLLASVGTLPVASFRQGQVTQVVEGDQGHSFVTVTVVLDRPPDPGKTAVVAYETRPGGSAFENVDFVAQRGTLTFSGAQTEASFRLRIIGDRIAEQDEQFAVRLVEARSRGVEIGDAQVNITIVDDDFNDAPVVSEPSAALVPRVRIAPLADDEGQRIPVREGDAAQFVIYLDRVSNQPITVRYRTHEPAIKPIEFATAGRDYVSIMGTVTFRPGETRKIISVKTFLDNELEVIDPATGRQLLDGTDPVPEIFNVLLYDPVNAVLAGGESLAVAQIIDARPEPPAPPPGVSSFNVTLRFDDPTGFSTTQIDAFAQAAARWEQIIVGDLPGVVDPETGEFIDDILILVSIAALDGPGGTLAQAGPTELRAGVTGLPWKAEMEFDTADILRLERNGDLLDVAIHEIGHALGFGTLWQQQGLIQGAGSNDPAFIGANAVREYNASFGQSARSVPVENVGGQGTRDSHWRQSVFGSEIMSGQLVPGAVRPISRITVGQFQDLGYKVNYAAADAYGLPRSPFAGNQSPPVAAPPAASPPVVSLPLPGARLPITRVPVSRPPVSTQPISGTPVVRLPITAR